MNRLLPIISLALLAFTAPPDVLGREPESKAGAKEGREAVRGRPPLNPPLWSRAAYDNAWKQWGLKAKPANYDAAFRERYGLHEAPYDNDRLPMGLHVARGGLVGKGLVNDCLLCHAGTVAGQTVIGLGNASLDLQGLFDDLSAADNLKLNVPFRFSSARGTIDPVNPTVFLMSFRDADLNLQAPVKLDYSPTLASDPPAWWLLKKKKSRNWTGGVDARSVRVDMVNLLSPLNSGKHVKKQEPVFAAIHAFILGVQAPKFPFRVDQKLAVRGRKVFENTCSRCHGTYGASGTYPNKVVPLAKIGTDRLLAEALSEKTLSYVNKSWLGREKRPDGKLLQIADRRGYQAPPLDGVWATAPYFHNGSVPTVYHVLNSKARPKVFTRSYRTGKEEYDPVKLGWRVKVLGHRPGGDLPGSERRKIYDTTQRGQANSGHTFGDALTEDERAAVIEYLKTL
jgi:mono/diheme cytochrome c family protein